jgi:site-specific recombinase XerD
LLHLAHEVKAAPSTVNVYAGAIQFLYRVTLKRPEVVADVVRVKEPMRLPRFLSGAEVERLLVALPTLRHQAMAMLAYGAGLRVREIVRLEARDIEAKRRVIHVREAKRGRERYVMLWSSSRSRVKPPGLVDEVAVDGRVAAGRSPRAHIRVRM